ncbi:hypothetical protein ATM17_30750 (plasmid) [Sphingopyxis macrogoltabida]|uniref:Uncharacterized protein n=2 Tax=Sphingopyxis macrogoltabida TaxID=33050 RepID=A0AAC9AZ36_SPHMC|nr:hypothetical protein ATM17_30750 [Sphingopyxis macrogoltabida]
MHFNYSPDWLADSDARPLSHALPKRGERFGDALCKAVLTHMWPELSATLAMRFGRAPTLEDVDADSFERFANDGGFGLPSLRRRAAALGASVQSAIADGVAVPGLWEPADLGDLPAIVSDRAGRLALKALQIARQGA